MHKITQWGLYSKLCYFCPIILLLRQFSGSYPIQHRDQIQVIFYSSEKTLWIHVGLLRLFPKDKKFIVFRVACLISRFTFFRQRQRFFVYRRFRGCWTCVPGTKIWDFCGERVFMSVLIYFLRLNFLEKQSFYFLKLLI